MAAQTIQQQRARYALEQVNKAIDAGVDHKEYKSYASGLPAMIHMNGLGQAAAFYKSKGVGASSSAVAYASLYQSLSDWLCGKATGLPDQPYSGCENLLEGITTRDMDTYRLAQAEAQALMDWVKKFAKAFMTKGDENEEEDN